MLQAVLILLFAVNVFNFILIWDLMNRTKRLGELHVQAEKIMRRMAYALAQR